MLPFSSSVWAGLPQLEGQQTYRCGCRIPSGPRSPARGIGSADTHCLVPTPKQLPEAQALPNAMFIGLLTLKSIVSKEKQKQTLCFSQNH